MTTDNETVTYTFSNVSMGDPGDRLLVHASAGGLKLRHGYGWFAWRPVRLVNGEVAWLRWVTRWEPDAENQRAAYT